MFKGILIANRGEIACRIAGTCKRLGIRSIAVYSEADADSLHVGACDDAYFIGDSESKASYLNIDAIVNAALESGAEAIHPGYGFLSENAEFATKVADAHLVFIGPSPATVTCMGDKIQAKALATDAGVPTVPGVILTSGKKIDCEEIVKTIGLPLLVKATGGGGGRGMRVVRTKDELAPSIESASREAQSFFGNGTVFIEKLLEGARHVEVQIFGCPSGEVYHLGTRDCTFQRNHQKIIEEAPAPDLSDMLREKLHSSAVLICKKAQYQSAGTVEFLVKDNSYYFLEVNSRLQVEHPVTELVYGVDLVELQLRGASGEKIQPPGHQPKGHAIECRLCCESPRLDFQSDTGMIVDWEMPKGDVRVDTGFRGGSVISHYYDSLLAKIIVHREERIQAIQGVSQALTETIVSGVRTNLEFLQMLVNDRLFLEMKHHTNSAHAVLDALIASPHPTIPLIASLLHHNSLNPLQTPSLDSYRLHGIHQLKHRALINGAPFEKTLQFLDADKVLAVEDSIVYSYSFSPDHGKHLILSCNGSSYECWTFSVGDSIWVTGTLGTFEVQQSSPPLKKVSDHSGKASSEIRSPLPGKLLSVIVSKDDSVYAGQTLAIIESMKMEHTICSPEPGIIEKILKVPGTTVQRDDLLFILCNQPPKAV